MCKTFDVVCQVNTFKGVRNVKKINSYSRAKFLGAHSEDFGKKHNRFRVKKVLKVINH